MKLSPAEKCSLYELTISTGRPDAETARLVQLGLVEAGSGKFGQYARITAKGRALAETFNAKDLDMMSGRGARAASGKLAATKGEPPLSMPVALAPSPRSIPPGRHGDDATPAPIPRSKPHSPASTTPADSAAARRETPYAGGTANPAPSPIPNAVRVVGAARVSYYPIEMWESLHGTKQRCFTRNAVFSSAPMGAPTADDVIF